MRNDWKKFKDLCKEIYIQTKELVREYLDWIQENLTEPWWFLTSFPLHLIFTSIFILYLSLEITLLAFIAMLILIHPIYRAFKKLSGLLAQQIKKKAKEIYLAKTSLAYIYSESLVADILCNILRNNAKELELVRPSIVGDIIPTWETVSQTENSFPFYRYICQYTDNENTDMQHMIEILDLKISQYLQAHFYMYPIIYRDVPVLKIFNISESLYQRGCYSLDIMVIDNEEKYYYCKSLEKTTDSPNVIKEDKDF